ncbi:MAG: alcohol dehydrogenase catalytic domain-containing protein, partial [Alphaproteobacteria bacterium]
MKALVLREHGSLENLHVVEDYPDPKATSGHVVIRVGASSFNYHDIFTMRGMPGIKIPLPVIIGLDMAGEMTSEGGGGSDWKAGGRVLVSPGQ